MRKWTGLVLAAVLLSAFCTSAQVNPIKKRLQRLKESSPKVDLQSEPDAAPMDKLTVDEFFIQRADLKGKVIELEFDRVSNLRQSGSGYTARVTYERVRESQGISILFAKDGFDFFEKLAEPGRGRSRETVYVEVVGSNILRGLGTRYNKNKPQGERYSW